jgi:hypothetical protein
MTSHRSTFVYPRADLSPLAVQGTSIHAYLMRLLTSPSTPADVHVLLEDTRLPAHPVDNKAALARFRGTKDSDLPALHHLLVLLQDSGLLMQNFHCILKETFDRLVFLRLLQAYAVCIEAQVLPARALYSAACPNQPTSGVWWTLARAKSVGDMATISAHPNYTKKDGGFGELFCYDISEIHGDVKGRLPSTPCDSDQMRVADALQFLLELDLDRGSIWKYIEEISAEQLTLDFSQRR